MVRFIAICVAPLVLSGCFTSLAMEGMNGAASCPPQAIQEANQNYTALSMLQPNQSLADYPDLADPEKSETLTLSGGQKLKAFFFRTGHARCRYMPTEAEYTPVLVSLDGRVQGVGAAAYIHAKQHALTSQRHSYVAPRSLTDILL